MTQNTKTDNPYIQEDKTTNVSPQREIEKQPIAIIGIGCRLPGDADSPEAFWQLLRDGVDAISEVPTDRWNVNRFYDPNRKKAGKTLSRCGGFIKDIDHFDAPFFGVSPREAARIDPQQRLLLEVGWEALEDAGLVPQQLAGSNSAVFIGISSSDYYDMQLENRQSINAYTNLGGHYSIAANRISYQLNFTGPSMAVDTACSSSLVAVHLACQSLWNGESSLALAGGVNAILKPEMTIAFSKASMLSPDGRCKSFDARANGYVRAEGAGIVVLKPLSSALADGDPIYALIRNTVVNQDGRTKGITVPNGASQVMMLEEAYRQVGIEPSAVQYIEAHGTGTPVGDPIEAKALGQVLSQNREPGNDCWIGSVKSNIGHLESGSGIAGLIKVALCLKHRQIPPNLHFESPNPDIPFEELQLRVPQRLESFPNGKGPRIAGVNSFGFGGANAHVVLQEAPTEHSQKVEVNVIPTSQVSQISEVFPQLLPLSAHSPEALRAMAEAYKAFCATSSADLSLADICANASLRRGHHTHRLALVADSKAELVEHIDAFLAKETRLGTSSGRPLVEPKLVFVFPGMGQQWWAMGRQLFAVEPVFQEAITRCDTLLRQYVDWSLIEELMADKEDSRINQTQIAQPAIFALQVALAALWGSWGIEPDAIVGHSVGEVAAAHVAGALSLEDAVRLIFPRSQLQAETAGEGQMLAVWLSKQEIERVFVECFNRVPEEHEISIAAINSPNSVTLAGETDALSKIADSLKRSGRHSRFLHVEVPYHSPKMEQIKDDLIMALQEINPQPTTVPLFSTVTGQAISGEKLDPTYWWQNVRHPVCFAAAMDELIQTGHNLFLEISAHHVLSRSISQCLKHAGKEGTVLRSLWRQKPERAVMLGSFGQLYTLGYPVDWNRLYAPAACGFLRLRGEKGGPQEARRVRLPSYPWQRERYWNESEACQQGRLGQSTHSVILGQAVHPLLGSQLQSAHPVWDVRIDKEELPYLNDHRIGGEVIYPGAAYVEMALASSPSHVIEQIKFQKALFLSDETVTVQFIQRDDSFEIYSQNSQKEWTRHATGKLAHDQNGELPQPLFLDEIRDRLAIKMSRHDCYQRFEEMGFQYGRSFQGIQQLWLGIATEDDQKEALAAIQLPEGLTKELSDYHLHPALLDACFQLLLTTVEGLYLPVQIDRVKVYRRKGHIIGANGRVPSRANGHQNVIIGANGRAKSGANGSQKTIGAHHQTKSLWSYARLHSQSATDIKGDIQLLDEAGNVLVDIQGFHGHALQSASDMADKIEDYLYQYEWDLSSSAPHQGLLSTQQPGSWLIFTDREGIGRQLAKSLQACGELPILISPGGRYQPLDANQMQIRPDDLADFQQLFEEVLALDGDLKGIIHLWSLDSGSQIESASLESAQTLGCLSVLHLIHALRLKLKQAAVSFAPRLWLVTRGAQSVNGECPEAIHQSPLWGLGRVIMNEQSDLRCKLIDLSPIPSAKETEALFSELWLEEHDEEIAWRDTRRYVHRLKQGISPVSQGHLPFNLEVGRSGIEDLLFRASTRRQPGPGEVEIEVMATALNFKDVAKATGLLEHARLEKTFSGRTLGLECAGRISAIGAGVEGFEIGAEVMALAACSFGTYAITDARFVRHKPVDLTFEEAATMPIVFLTAYYALHELGRLRAGERILIHSATGGVGLAALQLAQQVGADVFATAGNPEKRAFLRDLGVKLVMDSRSLAFADQVMAYTDGEGIDLVLNTLPGETIANSISTLRAGGRFIDISNIYSDSKVGLRAFQKGLSFFAFDLDQLMRSRPDFVGFLFGEAMQYIADKGVQPRRPRIFPISDAVQAFRYMAQAKHIGKIVLSMKESQASDLVIVPSKEPVTFDAEGTYLITGGLSGFGLATANFLASHGARHLVLMGRSRPSQKAQMAITTMQKAGTEVTVAKADVTCSEQVAHVLADIPKSMPLKGVIHAANVYDDAVLLQLNQERLQKVMAPKVIGAWTLHTQTMNHSLDFFVLFSSITSLIGNPGQGNYVAANAFLDELAHYRHALGLPALSINWGAVAEVGYVAKNKQVGKHLERIGVTPLPSRKLLEILGRLLKSKTVQTAVAAVEWQKLSSVVGASPRFEHLYTTIKGEQTTSAIRKQVNLEAISKRVAHVLGTSPTKLDKSEPLNNFGIDSLMAGELVNLIKGDFGMNVSTMKLLAGISIAELTTFLTD